MSNPNDCLEISPFRFGPVPPEGGVFGTPPHPDSHGYGGSTYGLKTYGDGMFKSADRVWVGGYGMSSAGLDPYGNNMYPAPPWAIVGGYGGDPYGLAGAGSVEKEAPIVTGAISLDGTRIEVFFSEPMALRDSALLDTNSYKITAVVGGLSTPLSVEVGIETPSVSGANSVILTHTGTMLGGVYVVAIVSPDPDDWEGKKAPADISGNPMVVPTSIPTETGDTVSIPVSENVQTNKAVVLTRGEAPTYTVSPISGDSLVLDFSTPMLPEADFSPGIEVTDAYHFQSDVEYPIQPSALEVEHPYNGDLTKVKLLVKGMTSLSYLSNITPAKAINYDGTYLPNESEDFQGSEEGVGSSATGSLLSLTKEAGDSYGWWGS